MAFEWVRAMVHDARWSLAFVGDLTLVEAIEPHGPVRSRVQRPVIVRTPTKADVAALAALAGVEDRNAVVALSAVARKRGALRNVANVLARARRFAGDQAIEAMHVRAAIVDLKLAPEGGTA